MSNSYQLRIDLLEKKVEVLQSEISQVLGEMQTTIAALTKMVQVGMRITDERLTALEPQQESTVGEQDAD